MKVQVLREKVMNLEIQPLFKRVRGLGKFSLEAVKDSMTAGYLFADERLRSY
jgi:hypothetical protein